MRRIFFIAEFFSIACSAPSRFRIVKFDKTSENASAFRECQKTFAVAVGQDYDGFDGLKIKCLSTLNITTSYYQIERPENEMDGCEMVERAGYNMYYMCPISSR